MDSPGTACAVLDVLLQDVAHVDLMGVSAQRPSCSCWPTLSRILLASPPLCQVLLARLHSLGL